MQVNESEATPQLPGMKDNIEIRLEIIFRRFNKKKSLSPKIVDPVQGVPLVAFLRVKNLSSKVCNGFRLKELHFNFQSENIVTYINNDIQVPVINPKSQVEVELDSITLHLSGACWFSCKLEPTNDDQELTTYQHDRFHEKDEVYSKLNEWGEILYVEGKLAVLQANTNKYILLLTVITVLEAVFGLKNILRWFSIVLSFIFEKLADIFVYLSSIT